MADTPDLQRHHQNNMDHARHVFLSVLFSTPKTMWFDEIEKLIESASQQLEKDKEL